MAGMKCICTRVLTILRASILLSADQLDGAPLENACFQYRGKESGNQSANHSGAAKATLPVSSHLEPTLGKTAPCTPSMALQWLSGSYKAKMARTGWTEVGLL